MFGSLTEPKKTASTRPPTPYRFFALRSRPQFSGVRMQLGFPACEASDRQRHAAELLNAVIAGGAGSRLTRLVRGKTLPATEVASSLLQFSDAGVLSIRLRATPKQSADALEVVVGELRRLTTEAVEDQELRRAKSTTKAAMLTRIDTPMARIDDLARQERYFGGMQDWLGEFAALATVTPNDLRRLASEWIGPHNLSLAVLGNLKGVAIRPKVLEW
jgi:predicted Zn-dependent peptidase